jgi:hypothetical protein
MVRARVTVVPGAERVVAWAFAFDTAGEVQLPAPW